MELELNLLENIYILLSKFALYTHCQKFASHLKSNHHMPTSGLKSVLSGAGTKFPVVHSLDTGGTDDHFKGELCT